MLPVDEDDFNDAVESYRGALQAFVHGDPEAALALFSRRDDVTVANPLGPPQRGRTEVERVVRAAAANFRAGTVQFEELSRYQSADLGYVVHVEPSEVQLATGETARITLRVTMIFRYEEGAGRSFTATPIRSRPLDQSQRPSKRSRILGSGCQTPKAPGRLRRGSQFGPR